MGEGLSLGRGGVEDTSGGGGVIRAEEPDLYEEQEDHVYENLYDMNGEVLALRKNCSF